MATLKGRWQWILVAAVFAALFGPGMISTARGARVLAGALQPAEAFAEQFEEREVNVPMTPGDELSMTVYSPLDGDPSTTLVLIHGAAPLGCRDPRLRALASSLARSGLTVACPQLDALAAFRVDRTDIEHIEAAARWAARRNSAGSVALLGVSIGGSYALVAAGRPSLDKRLSAVLCFGAAADLGPSVIDWLAEPTGPPTIDGAINETAGRAIGSESAASKRRTLLLANLQQLVPPDEVDSVRAALQADETIAAASHQSLATELSAGTTPLPGSTRAADIGLSAVSRNALALGRQPALADADTVRAVFAPLLTELAAVSPSEQPVPRGLTVFLAHGSSDPLVPRAQLTELAVLLDDAGSQVQLEVTEVFDHVGAVNDPGWLETLSLARFLGRFLDAADG